jgi:hypothetical protein
MWALADSQNILTKFGLEKIPVKNIGQFSDFEDLEDSVDAIGKEVRQGSVCDQQEGCVFTFVEISKQGPHQNKVISMAKVKALELLTF